MCFCVSIGYLDYKAFIIQSQILITPVLSGINMFGILLKADENFSFISLTFLACKLAFITQLSITLVVCTVKFSGIALSVWGMKNSCLLSSGYYAGKIWAIDATIMAEELFAFCRIFLGS